MSDDSEQLVEGLVSDETTRRRRIDLGKGSEVSEEPDPDRRKLAELVAAAEVVLVGDELPDGRTGLADQTLVNVNHSGIEKVFG
jgi:hypothetical protein